MSEPKFKIDSRVMAFHGPLLYEGKVVQYEDRKATSDDQHWYKVHYLGWSKKWDDWAPEKFVLEYNEESCKKQAELYSKIKDEKKHKRDKQASKGEPQVPKSVHRKRRQAGEGGEGDDLDLPLGNQMCKRLVDDWEMCSKKQHLLKLPHRVPVSVILEDFVASRAKKAGGGPQSDKVWREITDGLSAYFESALGQLLLYRFERQQYNTLIKSHPDKRTSEIYGCEHLLRLFVKLPQLLAQAKMEPETLQVLQGKLSEVLKFLHKNSDKFLSEHNYAPAPESYIAEWKAIESAPV